MCETEKTRAEFHLPGLYEHYDFYKVFLPVYSENRQWFYEWAQIASIYGAPADCIWGGGRFGAENDRTERILALLKEYGISARLTFSNSLLREEHLTDERCNRLCSVFEKAGAGRNGVIVHSHLLTSYLKKNYPNLFLVSSTTKVLTDFLDFREELNREDFRYTVIDFRFNKRLEQLLSLSPWERERIEFLCNEGCFVGCTDRKRCYESVSRKILGEAVEDFVCRVPDACDGYRFSKAMKSPSFIGTQEIRSTYLPNGFVNFKIEGRNLGSALLLEMLLYYLTKPEYRLEVREKLYLDSMLDLF